MNWQDFFNRLEFKNDLLIDHDIHSVAAIKLYALVNHRQRDLTSEWKARGAKFETETLFIGRLEQTRPKMPVHLYCHANDQLTQSHPAKWTANALRYCLRASVSLW